MIVAPQKMLDREPLAVGASALAGAAQQHGGRRASGCVVHVDHVVVEPARHRGAVDRRVGRAKLCATLHPHEHDVEPVTVVADLRAVGQSAEGVPDCRCRERVHRIGQPEGGRHLAEAGVDRHPGQVAQQHVTSSQLDLVPSEGGRRAGPEALLGVVEQLDVRGCPGPDGASDGELRRVNDRLGDVGAHLVVRRRMSHQIPELTGGIATLVVGDAGEGGAQGDRVVLEQALLALF